MESKLYFLHLLSATHVGIGQGVGVIDLPIAREKSSSLPMIPGSAIKGVLRNEMLAGDAVGYCEIALFGPDNKSAEDENNSYAGSLVVGDAHLLALAVRSMRGTIAYATCPFILKRLNRDLTHIGKPALPIIEPSTENIQVTKNSCLVHDNKVYLEDLDLQKTEAAADAIAETLALLCFADNDQQQQFKERFAVLSDEVFIFLAETATEIRARIRMKPETRTTQDGALWYEENLPAETLLWGLVATDRSFHKDCQKKAEELLKLLTDAGSKRLQIGGKATVGRGMAQWYLPE